MIYLKTYENSIYDNNNDEPFWGNFAAGVLPYSLTTKRFLINYRSIEVNEQHTWGVWGGKLDDNENIKEAVIREFDEESGYNKNIELIDAFIFKNHNGKFTYYNFIGLIENEFIPELNWESEDYKWATLNELYSHKNLHFGLKKLLKESKNIIENL